ncbi:uncharacterized protein PRCAT00005920001 [Priceomyces carsonii]|uniref:uncharacterized protein n=1 Tax=Priceomyces carsonii TaxID=28549 RepID=UPI002EDA391C|nr:unnamed protein product [Priceomyces carsonii]
MRASYHYNQEQRNLGYKESTQDDDDRAIKRANMGKLGFDLGLVDIKNLEYGVRNLQKSIKLIIKDSPDLKELDNLMNSSLCDSSIRRDIRLSNLMKLAAKLKTKYKVGDLSIFDSIVNNNVAVNSEDIIDSALTDPQSEKDGEMLHANEDEKDIDSTSGSYPALPSIKSPALYDRVFLHKSIVNNLSYLEQAESINKHNERLEFLGDSILNNLVTFIIYKRFPNASEGELSKIRSLLVNNHVLTEFSLEYGFDKKLRSNINESALRQGKQKIYADIFEAYIGALAMEHESDYSEIKQWLLLLMEPKIKLFDKEFENREPVNKDAKSDLYSHIGSALFHPSYEIIQHGDGASKNFVIECRMGEETLGEGEAPSHKEAGLRAAMAALKNKPLVDKYSQFRQTLDRNESVISSKAKISSPLPYQRMDKLIGKLSRPSEADIFPLEADDLSPINIEAKNELYAIIFKNLGESPEYNTFDVGDHKMKTELKIRGIVAATATDSSKKKSLSRAAMALLNNNDGLHYFKSLAPK